MEDPREEWDRITKHILSGKVSASLYQRMLLLESQLNGAVESYVSVLSDLERQRFRLDKICRHYCSIRDLILIEKVKHKELYDTKGLSDDHQK